MLTEAVMDGSQAIRDPVGGSVEFHFVPILKLISTLLIMGIFNDDDVKHILKMIDPNVFSPDQKNASEEKGEGEAEDDVPKEEGAETKEKEEGEEELLDEGVGEEEEDEELKALKKEEGEEGEKAKDMQQEGQKVDGEKAEEEKEAEEGGEVEQEEEEEAPEEGLLQMKLPESVKLQVSAITSEMTTLTTITIVSRC